MNQQTWARAFIVVSLFISGLVETLGASGLVVQLSPDGRWESGVHTLAVGGPLQIVGAAVLAFGRNTRWALIILSCYIFLVGAFGNLPMISDSNVGGSALGGLLGNLAVMGGIFYWFQSARVPHPHRDEQSGPITNHVPALLLRTVVCLAILGGVFCWLRSERMPGSHRAKPVTAPMNHTLALPIKLLA
jgi:hypothetical protein